MYVLLEALTTPRKTANNPPGVVTPRLKTTGLNQGSPNYGPQRHFANNEKII